MDFLSHGRQLRDLVFDFVLELGDLTLEVLHGELVQHDDLVVAMLTQEAFEADRTEVILAESLDVFCLMDLALGVDAAASQTVDRFDISNVRAIIGCRLDVSSRMIVLVILVSLHGFNFFVLSDFVLFFRFKIIIVAAVLQALLPSLISL